VVPGLTSRSRARSSASSARTSASSSCLAAPPRRSTSSALRRPPAASRPAAPRGSDVRSLLGPQRTAVRQLAEPEILLPLARARGSAGPSRLHRAPSQGLRDADRRVRLRQDHALARAHPAARGRALRDRPAHEPELDGHRLPARSALPARRRDARDGEAGAPAPAQRRVLPELPGRPRHRDHRRRGPAHRGRLRVRGAPAAHELPDGRPLPRHRAADRLARARGEGAAPEAPRPAHRHPVPSQHAGRHAHRQLHRAPAQDGGTAESDVHRRSDQAHLRLHARHPAGDQQPLRHLAARRLTRGARARSTRRSSPRSSRTWSGWPDGADERSRPRSRRRAAAAGDRGGGSRARAAAGTRRAAPDRPPRRRRRPRMPRPPRRPSGTTSTRRRASSTRSTSCSPR